MKGNDTEPEYTAPREELDPSEVKSKPLRDPSLDTLLGGFEERIQDLRVHRPPSAHTDPFPEEPVVAAHLTAPISDARPSVRDLIDPPRPTPRKPRHDPTFVLEKPEKATTREKVIGAGALVVVASAIGVAVWAAQGRPVEADAVPLAEPVLAAPPPAAAPLPSVVAAPAPSAVQPEAAASSAKPGKPTKPGTKPNGRPMDGRLN